MKTFNLCLICFALLSGHTALCAEEMMEPSGFETFFLGHETEPSMDYSGRSFGSLHQGICGLAAKLTHKFHYLAPAYELPFAIFLSTVQHEVSGHGGRAREFNLKPDYGFGLDFSAYTTIDRDPSSNEELIYISSGGTESTGIQARRILLDLCKPGGTPASLIPLMFFSKMDITVYPLSTTKPRPGSKDDDDSFAKQFDEGNDIAIYLVSRQAQRTGADPVTVWNREVDIDYDDPLLKDTWTDVQNAAYWNLLDPMVWASMYLYVKEHVIGGKIRTPPPAVSVTENFAFTVGTRAGIGPQTVSRFLDLYLLTGACLINIYGRDLVSGEDTTYGYGLGVHRLRLGRNLQVNACADFWTEPDSAESLYKGTGWNASAEIEVGISKGFGLALKAGSKTEGFFPGTPVDAGVYFGGGATYTF